MSDDVHVWLRYADDNLRAARLLLDHGLFNPCLQNAQQAAEKALKAVLAHHDVELERTHGIARWPERRSGSSPSMFRIRNAISLIPFTSPQNTQSSRFCPISFRARISVGHASPPPKDCLRRPKPLCGNRRNLSEREE
jgi:hypothetical protein